MKIFKLFKPAVLILLAASLTGCIEIKTLVTVNKDGSGTVEETVMLSKEMIAMFTQLQQSFGDSASAEPFSFYNPEELKTDASKYGADVQYISSQKVSRGNKEGYIVIYEFKDLNKLRINQNPNSKVKLEAIDEKSEVDEEFVTFSFINDKEPEIRIQLPLENKPKDSSKTTAADTLQADTSAMNEQLMSIFKDLKISMMLKVNGQITNTNAQYKEGSEITLMDLNFGELIQNADKLKEFREADPQNMEEVKKILEGIPGIKLEMNNPVFVKFR